MLITSTLTVGQITFILRAVIQVLSYGGLFLIGLLILANTPRIASITTHGIINSAVGKSNFTWASVKWMWGSIRGNSSGAVKSTRLLIAVFLLTIYSFFTSLSDIGFLGFYTCSVPGPSMYDYPTSIDSDNLAQSAVRTNLVNGTDPSTVTAYRCNSVAVVNFGNVTERNCTAWRNSTWADASLFSGINMTDSDILMPRQLARINGQNNFFLGVGNNRIESALISRGVAISLYETGFQAVFRVPQLAPQHKVTLDKAMALEVEVGCMTLGISSASISGNLDPGIDVFQTNGSWRFYSGPDYLKDILTRTVDTVRQYHLPLFNKSSLTSNGTMVGINNTAAVLYPVANINSVPLPTVPNVDRDKADLTIFGNCTNSLRQQLNLTVLDSDDVVPMCSMLGIGGLVTLNGILFETQGRMICASTSQINMVSATIETDPQSSVSVALTRLPSDLHYLRASYWNVTEDGDNMVFVNYMPLKRYTLSDNSAGPTSHFIVQNDPYLGLTQAYGPGSGGNSLSRAASLPINPEGFDLGGSAFVSLTILDAGTNGITFNTSTVTQWAAGVAASYALASVGYNGWAARDSAPMLVSSTGGSVATCYHPIYAIGFLPLVLTASFIAIWSIFSLATAAFTGSKHLEELYTGLAPYKAVVCPDVDPQATLLVWENKPQPHLSFSPEQILPNDDG